jgi:hypothetical protein
MVNGIRMGAFGRQVGVVLALATALLGGCPPTAVEQCADGYVFDPTFSMCVLDTRTDAGPRDAAVDAMGLDTAEPFDGGPCSRCPADEPACVAGACVECAEASDCAGRMGRPFCDTDTNTCVQCEDASDCGMGTPACVAGRCVQCDDMTDCSAVAMRPFCSARNTCVACLDASGCTSVTASRCNTDTNTCTACVADTDCMHLAATPVCDETRGTCVQCTGDTEAARCGGNSCRRSDGVCTTTPRGSRDVCDACEADSECVSGQKCIRQMFGGTDLGGFCFIEATAGCGNTVTALRPYRSPTEATSVDGAAGTYCLPPTTTTCAGIRDTQSTTCTTDDDCGVAGLDDGYCPLSGTAAGACSYRCSGAFDCGAGLSCGGAPQHCRP